MNSSSGAGHNVYLGLRNQMLTATRAKLNLPAGSTPTEPWGVLMDWGITDATATIVALSDGNASVYLSSGGGYIGGQAHASIRDAARQAVVTARACQTMMEATSAYPLPERGELIFYALTDGGVFATKAAETDVRRPDHPLAALGNAMQNIITQYRLIESGFPSGPGSKP